eukprot:4825960-Pleurochrysis_carterae.AAC.3
MSSLADCRDFPVVTINMLSTLRAHAVELEIAHLGEVLLGHVGAVDCACWPPLPATPLDHGADALERQVE